MNTRRKSPDNTALSEKGVEKSPQTSTTKNKRQTKQILAPVADELDLRQLFQVLSEVRSGNFSARMPADSIGLSGKICDTVNEIISLNERLVEELTLARNTIGKMGRLNHRVVMPRTAKGSWDTAVVSINTLISDLVHPTIEIAHVISSVA
jgi:hypothetical protein